ncbi:MG2 domain-containing protein [Endothiovibrio diazotrophicus]
MSPLSRLLFALLLLFSGAAAAFEAPLLNDAAAGYRDQLAQRYREAPREAVESLREQGRAMGRQGRWDLAVPFYERLVAQSPQEAATWLLLATAQHFRANQQNGGGGAEEAARAAWLAWRLRGADEDVGARALFLLGAVRDRQGQLKEARDAYREGLEHGINDGVTKRLAELEAMLRFRLLSNELRRDGATATACLRFSAPLRAGRPVNYGDYLRLRPAVDSAVTAAGQELCLSGLDYGTTYQLEVRAGLPAANGERLADGSTLTIEVGNRPASLALNDRLYLLPRVGSRGLPLESVNVRKVALELLHINDRNLIREINDGNLGAELNTWRSWGIAQSEGERVWQGEMAIDGPANRRHTTLIPLDNIELQPGIYAVTARALDPERTEGVGEVAQWLLVSDLGLTSVNGPDGLHLFVRSLASAKPLAGVALRLYARNNGELGKVVSDADGHALFDPGLLRGEGGRTPVAVYAYQDHQDFNLLDLTRPAFDLSDRGVEGRAAPGPVDAFLYTERGVYRPGETVHLSALLRDFQARAIKPLPVWMTLTRPDGVVALEQSLQADETGAYALDLPLAATARSGGWSVELRLERKGAAVGTTRFQVGDFVPPTLGLKLEAPAEAIHADESLDLPLTAEYFYGAPGAGLHGEAELVLEVDPQPFPAYPAYRFGLIDEEWTPRRFPLELPDTDTAGASRLRLTLPTLAPPDRPLRAAVRASVFEPGGRPVNALTHLAVRLGELNIGIRPHFDGDQVDVDRPARFDVIALDRDGQPVAGTRLRYALVEEEYRYDWYRSGRDWNFRKVRVGERPRRQGEIVARADGPAGLELKPDWGDYRLEVYDPAGGAAAALRFHAGWAAAQAGDSPDKAEVRLDRARYRPGETARVFIQAPFAGEAVLTVAGERLYATRNVTLPAEGTELELPVEAAWGAGVYVMAHAFRPGSATAEHGPGRAIGLAWLGIDSGQTLTVHLDAPERITPRQRLELPIRVEGLRPGTTAGLTLAAVDEGILRLTNFASPDPAAHYLGKRGLAMEIRDLYGSLLDGRHGERGELRVGGDAALARQLGGPREHSRRTVALYSGPVRLDANGRATLPLEIPDFNGRLRLMAVAWDAHGVGQAQGELTVRDPLTSQLHLPRFLAPGDHSQLELSLDNRDAPTGRYHLSLSVEGPLALGEDGRQRYEADVELAAGQRLDRALPIDASGLGIARLALHIDGPDGLAIDRQWQLPLRAAHAPRTRRIVGRLEPGESVRWDAGLLADYLPGATLRLDLDARAGLDRAGLLEQLDRYPYGCLEQTVSTALPLLGRPEYEARIAPAIARVLDRQDSDGGFGLWSADDPAELWLSAYAMEFLTRARAAGHAVPEGGWQRGLDWLRQQARQPHANRLDGQVYALEALARAGQADPGQLRYLHDNFADELRKRPLAAALLGAALARYGERQRAEEAFRWARQGWDTRGERHHYGSPLRDLAALLALQAEAGVDPASEIETATRVSNLWADTRRGSTQELAWLALAAEALAGDPQAVGATVDGKPAQGPLELSADDLQDGLTVENGGEQGLWYSLTLDGQPKGPQPAAEAGLRIQRHFRDLDGQPVNLEEVRQNQLLVAVIEGRVLAGTNHDLLVVDRLPAGLELENAEIGAGGDQRALGWLPQGSPLRHRELRDDRYVAALEPGNSPEFHLSYLVRAVTPGRYVLPGPLVEDMYRPERRGQGADGWLTVKE